MRFKTDFNGYAVKFSPFEDGRIAVATSQNFGIIGNGRQYVLQVKVGVRHAGSRILQSLFEHLCLSITGYTARPAASCCL